MLRKKRRTRKRKRGEMAGSIGEDLGEVEKMKWRRRKHMIVHAKIHT